MKQAARQKHVISVIGSLLVTAAACYAAYLWKIPNPVVILAVVMIFFTALVNIQAGAASGLCILAYALFFFSKDHTFISFTPENRYKCTIIIFSVSAIYLLTAWSRNQGEKALQQVTDLNRKLAEQNIVLENESDHDPLTGIYNRRGGEHAASSLMKRLKANNEEALLCAMDIDDFKNINDAWGHGTGDMALQCLVKNLQKAFGNQCILTRTGGDEFGIALYGEKTAELERQIQNFCGRTFFFEKEGKTVFFQVSCGYAVWPLQADSPQELERKADQALYRAKAGGKNTALLYQEEMDALDEGEQKFYLRNAAENLPVSFLVYRADETEEILMSSASMLELCECRSFSELRKYTGGTFRGFIYPADREQVEKSIADQIHENRYGLDSVNYRIQTKNGKILRIHDIGRLVQDPNLGWLFYVVVYDRDTVKEEF